MKIRYFTKRGEAWLDFRDTQGVRRRIPSGYSTEAEAERNALAVITRWQQRQDQQLGAKADRPTSSALPAPGAGATNGNSDKTDRSLTFRQAFDKGMREREKWLESKDKKSIETSYEQVAADWGGDDAPLSKATRQAVLDWRAKLLARKGKRSGRTMAHSTINHRLSMLSTLLELAGLPPHDVKHLSTKGNGRVRRLTDKEIDDMRQWLLARPERPGTLPMAALILAGLETAARQSELLDLTWTDVGEDTVTFRDTKNGTSRVIPMSPALFELLGKRRYVAGGPFKDINQDRATALWDAARSGIGLAQDEEFVFHSLRHEKLSRLADSGANQFVIAAFAGHTDIATTKRYVHASVGAMRSALKNEAAQAALSTVRED